MARRGTGTRRGNRTGRRILPPVSTSVRVNTPNAAARPTFGTDAAASSRAAPASVRSLMQSGVRLKPQLNISLTPTGTVGKARGNAERLVSRQSFVNSATRNIAGTLSPPLHDVRNSFETREGDNNANATEKKTCKPRPEGGRTSGPGTSREFVPWCKKT